MPESTLTCFDFWCKAGSASETTGEEGIAHFLEHMVFKGSQRLGPGQFDRRIEALGGSSNAATGFDDVHFHALVPPEAAAEGLDLLLDLVLEPALEADAYAMERDVVLEEIAQYRDQPDDQVIQQLLTRCCPDQAYGRPILGWETSLLASTPALMRRFHERRYQGSNCCLAVAGALPAGLESRLTASAMAALPKKDVEGGGVQRTTPLRFKAGHAAIQVPRLEAARVLMAWPAAPAEDQLAVMGMDLATTVLAEGRRSRFVQHLREELQIVESIDMDLTVLEEGSLVMLEACCPPDLVERVEQEVQIVLAAVAAEPIHANELERARQLVGNGLRFSLEAPGAVAGIAGAQTLWGHSKSLLEPLIHLNHWDPETLRTSVFSQLQTEQAFTLVALPGDED
ncbi:M16 family metallopeptidase [Synechococcus sp. BS55D]|uniref:M16 family metallopeptidase n=1 Tax=Synechococcus sp. BS55D TaxID=2055943 RepID=UPI001038FE83|nr:pitrilysin family protein [Synechococcus sp. BS55D]TCD57468.1 insulinase family protein [Synechococcus sp. BS55D]